MASPEIEALTQALARLPGLGPRSARRAVLHLLKKRELALGPLRHALEQVDERLATAERIIEWEECRVAEGAPAPSFLHLARPYLKRKRWRTRL